MGNAVFHFYFNLSFITEDNRRTGFSYLRPVFIGNLQCRTLHYWWVKAISPLQFIKSIKPKADKSQRGTVLGSQKFIFFFPSSFHSMKQNILLHPESLVPLEYDKDVSVTKCRITVVALNLWACTFELLGVSAAPSHKDDPRAEAHFL